MVGLACGEVKAVWVIDCTSDIITPPTGRATPPTGTAGRGAWRPRLQPSWPCEPPSRGWKSAEGMATEAGERPLRLPRDPSGDARRGEICETRRPLQPALAKRPKRWMKTWPTRPGFVPLEARPTWPRLKSPAVKEESWNSKALMSSWSSLQRKMTVPLKTPPPR